MTIDLEHAYAWVCPKCGERQFVEAMGVELNREEAREMAKECGLSVGSQHHMWTTEPDSVMCVKCEAEFSTKEADNE